MTAVRGFAAYYAALRYFIIDRYYFKCGERRAFLPAALRTFLVYENHPLSGWFQRGYAVE